MGADQAHSTYKKQVFKCYTVHTLEETIGLIF